MPESPLAAPGATPDRAATRLWLRLLRAPGLGPRRLQRLLEAFGGIEAIYAAGAADWRRAGLSENLWRDLHSVPESAIAPDLEWLARPGCAVLALTDPDYPAQLREIPDPPPLLFVQGRADWLHQPQIALVGTRHPTPQGRDSAAAFARHLAGAGFIVTSGLAAGIDAAAHRGALAAGGLVGGTIAVAGTGLDRVYPAENRELAHRIAEQGLLVSELPIGTPPRPEHFPRRNRIISGLALGVLVVEAAERSGSLITARLAAEQGRAVLAIPGSIHNPQARGCNALIRDGARLVANARDVIEELAPWLGNLAADLAATNASDQPEAAPPPLDPEYRNLLAAMGYEPVAPDSLIQRSGLNAQQVASMLLLLELEGYVSSAPGGRYQRRSLADGQAPHD